MSIDYDRLREQLHTTTGQEHSRAPWQVGDEDKDGFFDVRDADFNVVAWRMTRKEAELVALAPDMARELLHLYSVVERFDNWLRLSARNTTTPATKNAYLDAQYILTELLEGDTE